MIGVVKDMNPKKSHWGVEEENIKAFKRVDVVLHWKWLTMEIL